MGMVLYEAINMIASKLLILSMIVVPTILRGQESSMEGDKPGMAAPQEKSPTIPRMIERRAQDILKKMSDVLAATPRFALEAEETFDELKDNQPRIQLTNSRRVVVVRPSRFVSDVAGDTLNRSVWFDGQTITSLDKVQNQYASLNAAGTIDSVLDMMMELFDIVVPLADFLYADPYAVLMEDVTYGRYLGIHQAAGIPCHHLAFAQETIEWQIWIDANNDPLPRKIVITYVTEPGEPQYSATITKWNLKPEIPENLFQFKVPQGAERVEPAELLNQEGE